MTKNKESFGNKTTEYVLLHQKSFPVLADKKVKQSL